MASGKVLADLLIDALPHIPVRDLETPPSTTGLAGEALADAGPQRRAPQPASLPRAARSRQPNGRGCRCSSPKPLEVVVETVAVADRSR